jgi:hypothetical protein
MYDCMLLCPELRNRTSSDARAPEELVNWKEAGVVDAAWGGEGWGREATAVH